MFGTFNSNISLSLYQGRKSVVKSWHQNRSIIKRFKRASAERIYFSNLYCRYPQQITDIVYDPWVITDTDVYIHNTQCQSKVYLQLEAVGHPLGNINHNLYTDSTARYQVVYITLYCNDKVLKHIKLITLKSRQKHSVLQYVQQRYEVAFK